VTTISLRHLPGPRRPAHRLRPIWLAPSEVITIALALQRGVSPSLSSSVLTFLQSLTASSGGPGKHSHHGLLFGPCLRVARGPNEQGPASRKTPAPSHRSEIQASVRCPQYSHAPR
jgi:hypothetical protein